MPVKPEPAAFDQQSVPALWLTDDDNDELAQRVDRLEADYEWVNDLALAGFAGKQWNFFAEELAKYGMAVIAGWMKNKLIYRRCQDRGFGGLRHLLRFLDIAHRQVNTWLDEQAAATAPWTAPVLEITPTSLADRPCRSCRWRPVGRRAAPAGCVRSSRAGL